MLLEILRNNYNVLPGVRAHGMYFGIYYIVAIVGGPRKTAKLPWSRTGPTENDKK